MAMLNGPAREYSPRFFDSTAQGSVRSAQVFVDSNVLWKVRRPTGSRLPSRTADWLAEGKVVMTAVLTRARRTTKAR
jgi:hypothetical protein